MDDSNPFGVDALSKKQIKRLLEAAKMIAGEDEEMLETIITESGTKLNKLIGETNNEEIIESAVDEAENLMPDIAFGDSSEMIDDFLTNDEAEAGETESLGQLLKEDEESDEFMGDERFTSLEEMQAKEDSDDPYSFETLQEDWN
ncbi:MAG: hypothetical protein KAS32_28745 [Candidatus Peribacteraceae bacterium]|nr:hypothetical protein [Candidatus Peribacteraceae bacterium]